MLTVYNLMCIYKKRTNSITSCLVLCMTSSHCMTRSRLEVQIAGIQMKESHQSSHTDLRPRIGQCCRHSVCMPHLGVADLEVMKT